ncbi:hypothetical protein BFW01_g12895 [Lasiodiplodia theobromae]|nr:hypothetical protein BFW01_g12895 [Lasiodiplodia theobromae]
MATSTDSSPCISQRAFPVWLDPVLIEEHTFSRLESVKHNSVDFKFQAHYNGSEGCAAIRFLLMVDLNIGGKSAKRPFLYVIPLAHLAKSDPIDCSVVSDSEMGHSPVCSAIRDTGFLASGHVIRVNLRLQRIGHVLSRPFGAGMIRPRTKTAHDLLEQFNSISNLLGFSFYLKHSAPLQKQLEDLCCGLRSDILKQYDVPLHQMQPLDWSKIGVDKFTRKRRRISSPRPPDNNTPLSKDDFTHDLASLFQAVIPTISPREYLDPQMQSYFDDFRTAVANVDAWAFGRAYGRFAVLLLYHSIHQNDPAPSRPSSPAPALTEQAVEQTNANWPTRRPFFYDLFDLVMWVRKRDRCGVPHAWPSFCELGRAMREATQAGVLLEDALGGTYGGVKARIMAMAVVGTGRR